MQQQEDSQAAVHFADTSSAVPSSQKLPHIYHWQIPRVMQNTFQGAKPVQLSALNIGKLF